MATAIPEIHFFHCSQCFGRFPASRFRGDDFIGCPHCGTTIEAPPEKQSAYHWKNGTRSPFARLERVVIPKHAPSPPKASKGNEEPNAVGLILKAFKQLPADQRHEMLGVEPPKPAKAKLSQSSPPSVVEIVPLEQGWSDIDWPKPAKSMLKTPQQFFQGQMIRAVSCALMLLTGSLLMSHLHAVLTEDAKGIIQAVADPSKTELATAPTSEQLVNTFTKFLEAETVEAKSGFVRSSGRVLPLMRRYYDRHPIVPSWIAGDKEVQGEFDVRARTIEGSNVFELILQPRPDLTVSAPFVLTDSKLQLDWEAFTGYGQTSVPEFFEQQPEVPTLLRATVRFETASGTPAHYKRVILGDLEGWSGPGYLPNDRLRFHEVLDLEDTIRDMNQVEGANSHAALTMRLAVQARFRKIVGMPEPVAVIESLVRPNWFAP